MKRYAVTLLLLLSLAACGVNQTEAPLSSTATPVDRTATTSPEPTEPPALSPTQLKYALIDQFGPVGQAGGIHYCDPDYWPVAQPEEEILRQALEQFPRIRQEEEQFQAMLERLGLQDLTEFSDEQKLRLYQESNKLEAIDLEPGGAGYTFRLGQYKEGEGGSGGGAGFDIQGTISPQGTIEVQQRDELVFGCPRCLASGSRIATPNGLIPVQELRPGTLVWTTDSAGTRRPAVVERVAHTPVPPGHSMVHLRLEDGRQLLASPGHPTADGRTLGDLAPGDTLDGAEVVSVQRVPYHEPATFDLLPSGSTGLYWADGILLGSTLSRGRP